MHNKGFPNLLFMCGPGALNPAVNVTWVLEQQVRHFVGVLRRMRGEGKATVEPRDVADAKAWLKRSRELSSTPVWARCNNYYGGAFKTAGEPDAARVGAVAGHQEVTNDGWWGRTSVWQEWVNDCEAKLVFE
jgi:hypothetical protein